MKTKVVKRRVRSIPEKPTMRQKILKKAFRQIKKIKPGQGIEFECDYSYHKTEDSYGSLTMRNYIGVLCDALPGSWEVWSEGTVVKVWRHK